MKCPSCSPNSTRTRTAAFKKPANLEIDPSLFLLGCANEEALSGPSCSNAVDGYEECERQQNIKGLIYDGFWNDEDVKDEDYVQPAEPTTPKLKTVRLEWSDTRSYIRSLVEEMDWRHLSIRDAHHLLHTMFVKGGGDPNDQIISYASVQRMVEEVRAEAVERIKAQKFPQRAIVHFDGAKCKLGKKNGARFVEHLSISVTGLGGEFHVGVFEVNNGTGKIWLHFLVVDMKLYTAF